MKKILLILLSLILAFSFTVPLTAYADYDDEDYYGEEDYEEDEDDEDDDDFEKEFLYEDLMEASFVGECYYGDRTVTGTTLANVNVILTIGKKTIKTKSDSSGHFKFTKVPVNKVGTKLTVRFEKNGVSYRESEKVKNNSPYHFHYFFYRNQTKVKGYVKNVHKGDVLILKIGKRTYKKKVKKNYKKMKYSYKVKKAKYGTKMKFIVKNKFNQTLTSYGDVVYYSSKLKRGMPMKQARCVPGWYNISAKDYYDTGTYWWYDRNGDGYASESYLYFNARGRLQSWHYKA